MQGELLVQAVVPRTAATRPPHVLLVQQHDGSAAHGAGRQSGQRQRPGVQDAVAAAVVALLAGARSSGEAAGHGRGGRALPAQQQGAGSALALATLQRKARQAVQQRRGIFHE